jgi:hypothetical protein
MGAGIMLFFIFFIAIFFNIITNKLDKKSGHADPLPPTEKRCPSHKWAWEEQIGLPGTYYIRCQWCRRLPGYDRNE